jgi:hypothetical protein
MSGRAKRQLLAQNARRPFWRLSYGRKLKAMNHISSAGRVLLKTLPDFLQFSQRILGVGLNLPPR